MGKKIFNYFFKQDLKSFNKKMGRFEIFFQTSFTRSLNILPSVFVNYTRKMNELEFRFIWFTLILSYGKRKYRSLGDYSRI